jgi:hypothetical protein
MEIAEEEVKKSLGNIANIKLGLTEPMNMNFSLETLRNLTPMCGKNGSGKTMVNKLIFFSSMVTLLIIIEIIIEQSVLIVIHS